MAEKSKLLDLSSCGTRAIFRFRTQPWALNLNNLSLAKNEVLITTRKKTNGGMCIPNIEGKSKNATLN